MASANPHPENAGDGVAARRRRKRTVSRLLEIAQQCAVSQSTVSRVLNNTSSGRFSVSAQVRQRILDTARELNYRPSVAARNLVLNRTRLVAIVGVGDVRMDRVGPADEAVGEVSRIVDEARYECIRLWSEMRESFDLPRLRVDGLVVVGAETIDQLAPFDATGVPYVSLNGAVGCRGCQVVADDRGGAFAVLRHLVDLGHRRIAYLDNLALHAAHPSVFERRKAFHDASREIGFETPSVGMPLLGWGEPWDSYYEPFLRKAVLQARSTAVVTYSHHGALSLLRSAHDLGLKVPGDFSVACFNDPPLARLSVPSLTAVDVPAAEMGRVAAELLLRRMESDEPLAPERRRIPEKLVVRESTAPPPSPTDCG